jgi:hypothetical protein
MRAVSRGMLAADMVLPWTDMSMIVSVRETPVPRESEPANRNVNRPSLPLLMA